MQADAKWRKDTSKKRCQLPIKGWYVWARLGSWTREKEPGGLEEPAAAKMELNAGTIIRDPEGLGSVDRMCTECVRNAYRMRTECVQNVYRMCTECVQKVLQGT